MANRRAPALDDWRMERLFGALLLVGRPPDGRPLSQPLLWWSNGRFGTPRGVFRQGRPAAEPFPGMEATR